MHSLRTLMAAATIAVGVAATPFALAHATLKSSDPQAGAVLSAAPKQVALTFNEKIEQAFSTVTVTGPDGKTVGVAKAKVDEANPAVVRLDLPALASGQYTVSWAVAGHDGHRRKGDFTFSVK